jgi:hypothetical protein
MLEAITAQQCVSVMPPGVTDFCCCSGSRVPSPRVRSGQVSKNAREKSAPHERAGTSYKFEAGVWYALERHQALVATASSVFGSAPPSDSHALRLPVVIDGPAHAYGP